MRKLLIAAIAWNGLVCRPAPMKRPKSSLARSKPAHGSEESLAKRSIACSSSLAWFFCQTVLCRRRRRRACVPDRCKWVREMKSAGGSEIVIGVLNGLRGWSKTSKGVADLLPFQYDAVRNEVYTYWLANLGPFTKSIKWELMKDAAVDGKPCRVLTATQAGRPAVMLYLDRDTALVLKAAYSGTESFQQTTKEYLFSAHREFEGQRLPGKVTVMQAGKRIEEWTSESIRFPSSIDDKEFAKPQ